MIYLLGGAGFVGSGFARYCAKSGLAHQIITRHNYDEFRGTTCDVLIDASSDARKFMADREAVAHFDRSVRQVAVSLEAFAAGTYVLISSADVYDDPSTPATTRESQQLDIARMSRYGQHKFLAEQLVVARHPNWLVIRAGGFVGPGLKKNPIFDLLTGGRIWLAPGSALQFIHTDAAAAVVMGLVATGIRREIVNLCGHGTVNIGGLHAELGSHVAFDPTAPTVTCELSLEKLARLSPAALPRSLDMVRAFVASWPEIRDM